MGLILKYMVYIYFLPYLWEANRVTDISAPTAEMSAKYSSNNHLLQ